MLWRAVLLTGLQIPPGIRTFFYYLFSHLFFGGKRERTIILLSRMWYLVNHQWQHFPQKVFVEKYFELEFCICRWLRLRLGKIRHPSFICIHISHMKWLTIKKFVSNLWRCKELFSFQKLGHNGKLHNAFYAHARKIMKNIHISCSPRNLINFTTLFQAEPSQNISLIIWIFE